MNYKNQIVAHLEDYSKLDQIDLRWVDIAGNALDQIEILTKQLKEEGSTQRTQSGYTAKNGIMQALEAHLKTYGTASERLGLSPRDREKNKWVKPREEESII